MKSVLKILTALAAVAGVVYAVATYGDKIVAWAKRLLNNCPCCGCTAEVSDGDAAQEAEEVPAEEEAAPGEAPVAAENEPVAEENDFEA